MNSEHLLYIPLRAKVIITTVAVLFFLASITIVLFLLVTRVDAGLVTTGLTLAQTCAAGLGVIALVFYTKFSVNVDFLKNKTETFILKELPEAMRIIEYQEDNFHNLDSNFFPKPIVATAKIAIKYDKGNHYCQYRVSAYGIDQRIYLQINVKRLVVSYFIDAGVDIQNRLEYVVRAAETAGYTYKYESVHDSASGCVSAQLRMFRTLPDDFLVNAGERLYVANDFASMTRAMIRALPAKSIGSISPPALGGAQGVA